MKLFRTAGGHVVEHQGRYYTASGSSEMNQSWNQLVARDDLEAYLQESLPRFRLLEASSFADIEASLLPPIQGQDVWASGVTYFRSRNARMEESRSAGGGDFYDRVYSAERPELFFKSTPERVVGHGGKVAIRRDAHWSIPEPELTLLSTPRGKIVGYTIGNDMSSRDIEGENPLYLPQAKVYDRSCALGPGILVSSSPLPPSTAIRLEIIREGKSEVSGSTTLSEMKREPATLVEYLYRENSFPHGSFLLTGTGVVPPDAFTLRHGDEIYITIDGIGTLANTVG
jgi:2-dehydro-3-deoxy-D-arabinonate dehydratase